MQDTNATFARYNKDFQEKLALILLDDKYFADRMDDVLNFEFLEQKYLQVFTELVFRHKREYKVQPSRAVMETILKSGLGDIPEVTKKMVRDYYARIITAEFEDEVEWIKSEALEFCRKQKLKEEMIKASKRLQKGSFEDVCDILQKALKLGADNDHGHEYLKDFEERYNIQQRIALSTGWKLVDNVTSGGLGKGELGVIIAPTGGGKSMALVHLAAAALKMGQNVVYYTLELSSNVVGRRFDSCLSTIRLDNLDEKKDDVKTSLENMDLGKLIIKKYPRRTATVNTLRSHLDKLINNGTKIDMIIVDYGDILKPAVGKNREKRHELEEIYEDLTTLVEEYNVVGWTATQTNRSGLNEEIITMESISEAYNKCFPAYFIISLSRTIADKNANTGRIFVAKNRNGQDGLVFNVFMDTANVDIQVLDSYVPDDSRSRQVSTDELNKTSLAKKFKSFQKNKN